MKRRGLSYEQALAKHPGCRVELTYMAVDTTYPEYETVPTATAPAIVVRAVRGNGPPAGPTRPLAVYWLREDE